MREYKIFKTELWYSIYRKKSVWELIVLQFLNGNDNRTTWKMAAKTFYTKESALSALASKRFKDGKENN